jgi:hypothetical protein
MVGLYLIFLFTKLKKIMIANVSSQVGNVRCISTCLIFHMVWMLQHMWIDLKLSDAILKCNFFVANVASFMWVGFVLLMIIDLGFHGALTLYYSSIQAKNHVVSIIPSKVCAS